MITAVSLVEKKKKKKQGILNGGLLEVQNFLFLLSSLISLST